MSVKLGAVAAVVALGMGAWFAVAAALEGGAAQHWIVDHPAFRAGGGQETKPVGEGIGVREVVGGIGVGQRVDLSVAIDDGEPMHRPPVRIRDDYAPIPTGEGIGPGYQACEVVIGRSVSGHQDGRGVEDPGSNATEVGRWQQVADASGT